MNGGSSPLCNETHEVLPPYRIVASPEQGVEPRTPWNLKSTTRLTPC